MGPSPDLARVGLRRSCGLPAQAHCAMWLQPPPAVAEPHSQGGSRVHSSNSASVALCIPALHNSQCWCTCWQLDVANNKCLLKLAALLAPTPQVLVYHDLLGMMQHPHHAKVTPKFCKQYSAVGRVIQEVRRSSRGRRARRARRACESGKVCRRWVCSGTCCLRQVQGLPNCLHMCEQHALPMGNGPLPSTTPQPHTSTPHALFTSTT